MLRPKTKIVGIALIFGVLVYVGFAQTPNQEGVTIGAKRPPHATAVLELVSKSKGLLVPRMTEAQKNAISVSQESDGLLIFQTDGAEGLYVYLHPPGAPKGNWVLAISDRGIAAVLKVNNDAKKESLFGLDSLEADVAWFDSLRLKNPLYVNSISNRIDLAGNPDSGALVTEYGAKRYVDSLIFAGDKQLIYNDKGKWRGDVLLVWDYNTKRLGIGTNTPSERLQVVGTIRTDSLRLSNLYYVDSISNDTTLGGLTPDSMNLVTEFAISRYLRSQTAPKEGQVIFRSKTGKLDGSDSLFWKEDKGFLGVGTNNPQARVHVQDGILQADTLRLSNDFVVDTISNDTFLGRQSPDSMNLVTEWAVKKYLDRHLTIYAPTPLATSSRQVVFNRGDSLYGGNNLIWDDMTERLGIGMAAGGLTAPQEKLHVAGVTRTDSLRLLGDFYVDSISNDILLKDADSNALVTEYALKNYIDSLPLEHRGYPKSVFYNKNDSLYGSKILVWDDTKNRLGVGTSTPQELLHVKGGVLKTDSFSLSNSVVVDSILNDSTLGRGLGTDSMALATQWATKKYIDNKVKHYGSDRQVIFNRNDSIFGSDGLIWDRQNNRLGVGTTTPTARVHVSKGILHSDTFRLANPVLVDTISNDTTLGGKTPDSMNLVTEYAVKKYLDFQLSHRSNNKQVLFNRNDTLHGSDRLVWDYTTGRLGVGTSTPGHLLEVRGGIFRSDSFRLQDGLIVDSISNDSMLGGVRPDSMKLPTEWAVRKYIDNKTELPEGGDKRIVYTRNDSLRITDDLTYDYTTVRMGVGTSTPQSRLDVRGGIFRTDSFRLQDGLIVDSISNDTMLGGVRPDSMKLVTEWALSRYVRRWHRSTDRQVLFHRNDSMVGDSQLSYNYGLGYLGVGLYNPSYRLHVANGGLRTDSLRLKNGVVVDGISNDTTLGGNRPDSMKLVTEWALRGYLQKGHETEEMQVAFDNNDTLRGSDNLIWDYNKDRLGIGTKVPDALVQVKGGVLHADSFRLSSPLRKVNKINNDTLLGSSNPDSFALPTEWAVRSYIDRNVGFQAKDSQVLFIQREGSELLLYGSDNLTWDYKGGRLGIGRRNPRYLLDVSGGVFRTDSFRLQNDLVVDSISNDTMLGGVRPDSMKLVTEYAAQRYAYRLLHPFATNKQILYRGAGDSLQGSDNLVWDYTAHRLGVGTSTPGARLDVSGGLLRSDSFRLSGSEVVDSISNDTLLSDSSVRSLVTEYAVREYINSRSIGSSEDKEILFNSGGGRVGGSDRLVWDYTTGRLGVGTSTPGHLLEVRGGIFRSDSFRLQDGLIVDSISNDSMLGGVRPDSMKLPTEWAVRKYIDNKAELPRGGDKRIVYTRNDSLRITDDLTYDYTTVRMGVGTSTPQSRLDVRGGIFRTDSFRLQDGLIVDSISNDSTLGGVRPDSMKLVTEWALSRYVRRWHRSTDRQVLFHRNDSMVGDSQLSYNYGLGYLGVGLYNPSYRLHVANGGLRTDSLRLKNGVVVDGISNDTTLGGNRPDSMKLVTEWALRGYLQKGHETEEMQVAFDNNDTLRGSDNLIWDYNKDRLGIGTKVPDALVQVKGGVLHADSFRLSSPLRKVNKINNDTLLGSSNPDSFALPTEWAVRRYIDRNVGFRGKDSQVLFIQREGSELLLYGSDNLTWDYKGGRLGIGRRNPRYLLDVSGGVFRTDSFRLQNDLVVDSISNDTMLGGVRPDSMKLVTEYAAQRYAYRLLHPFATNKQILYRGAGDSLQGSDNLVWDYTAHRLGVGTSTPGARLDVSGGLLRSDSFRLSGSEVVDSISNDTLLSDSSVRSLVTEYAVREYINSRSIGSSEDKEILFNSGGGRVGGSDRLVWDYTTGRLGVGTSTPGHLLEVRGGIFRSDSFRLQDGLIVDSISNDSTLGGVRPDSMKLPTEWAVRKYIDNKAELPRGGDKRIVYTRNDSLRITDDLTYDYTTVRMGVGTSTPQSRLDVRGGIFRTDSFRLQDGLIVDSISNDSTLGGVRPDSMKLVTEWALSRYVRRWHRSTDRQVLFHRNDSMVGDSQLSYNYGLGYLGVGLYNPSYRLHVANGGLRTDSLRLKNGVVVDGISNDTTLGGNRPDSMKLVTEWALRGYLQKGHETEEMQVAFDNNDTLRGSDNLIWDYNKDRLGIGTKVPDALVQVKGGVLHADSFRLSSPLRKVNKINNDTLLGSSNPDSFALPTEWAVRRYIDRNVGFRGKDSQVLFIQREGSELLLYGSDNLTWDYKGGRFGIGRRNPRYLLDVSGGVFRTDSFRLQNDLVVDSISNDTMLGGVRPDSRKLVTEYAAQHYAYRLLHPFATNKQILYRGAGDSLQGSDNLVWDYTAHRLGVGTSTPGARLDVSGGLLRSDSFRLSGSEVVDSISNDTLLSDSSVRSLVTEYAVREYINSRSIGSSEDKEILFNSGGGRVGGSDRLVWDYTTNRLGVGTSTPGHLLEVKGGIFRSDSFRLQDGLIVDSISNDSMLGGVRPDSMKLPTEWAVRKYIDNKTELPEGGDKRIVYTRNDSLRITDDLTYDYTTVRMGVGTSTPQSRLDVRGGIFRTDSFRLQDGLIVDSISNDTMLGGVRPDSMKLVTEWALSRYVRRWHRSTDRQVLFHRNDSMVGDSQLSYNYGLGYLGVGLYNPSYRLHVANGGLRTDSLRLKNGVVVDGISNDTTLGGNRPDSMKLVTEWALRGYLQKGHETEEMQVAFDNNDTLRGSDNLIWDYNKDRLGIGTKVPDALVQVKGGVLHADSFRLSSPLRKVNKINNDTLLGSSNPDSFALPTEWAVRRYIDRNVGFRGKDSQVLFIQREGSELLLYGSDNLTWDYKGGRLGIGRRNPRYLLDVSGGVFRTDSFRLQNDLVVDSISNDTMLGGVRPDSMKLVTEYAAQHYAYRLLHPFATNKQILYRGAGDSLQGSDNLVWDYTAHRLGVGTSTPGARLDVSGGLLRSDSFRLSGSEVVDSISNDTLLSDSSVRSLVTEYAVREYINSRSIGSSEDKEILFNSGGGRVGGSDRLVWDYTTGRLGVGTSTPGHLLEVRGGIFRSDSFRLQDGLIVDSISNDSMLGGVRPDSMKLPTEWAVRKYIDNRTELLQGGDKRIVYTRNDSLRVTDDLTYDYTTVRMGVGTSTPQSRLDVRGGIFRTDSFRLQDGLIVDSISNDSTLGGVRPDSMKLVTEWALSRYVRHWHRSTDRQVLFHRNDSMVGDSQLSYDYSLGYLGVGLYNPSYRLHVANGGFRTDSLRLSNDLLVGDISNDVSLGGMTPSSHALVTQSAVKGYLDANVPTVTASNGQILYVNSSSVLEGNANLFWDNTNKYLGLGTSTPEVSLHVLNGSSVGGRFTPGTLLGLEQQSGAFLEIKTTTDTGGIAFSSSKGLEAGIFYDYSNDQLVFRNTEDMVFDSNGYLGIGTNSPTYPLHVASTSSLPFTGTTSGIWDGAGGNVLGNISAFFSGWVVAQGFAATSDKRVKTNVVLSDGQKDLSILRKIKIVDYKYIDTLSSGNRWHKKVIAQDLKKVYPTAVNSSMKAFVPSIYSLASSFEWLSEGTLKIILPKAHKLERGDKVKLIQIKGKDQEELFGTVLSTQGEQEFTIKLKAETKLERHLFVYGKEVFDYHTVDYDALSTLSISAMQRLIEEHMKTQEEYDRLERRLDKIKERLKKAGIE